MAMDSLSTVEASLDALEEILTPLFEKPLSETISELELLQKAKLQVLIPYVVNDLVFIYLRTKGINPKTHPVVGELDRIKQYFEKIKQAEDPDERKFVVDQGAATRFIKHAITESKKQAQQNTHIRFTEDDVPVVGTTVPETSAGVTIEQEEASEAALRKIAIRKKNQEESESEEEDLAIISGDDTNSGLQSTVDKGKGREVETGAQRKRRRMDPWTGYIEPTDERQEKRARSKNNASSDSKQETPPARSDAGIKTLSKSQPTTRLRKAMVD